MSTVTHSQRDRGELVVLANGKRQKTFALSLVGVDKQVLGVETGASIGISFMPLHEE
jgi:hypothetical protein